MRDYSLFDRYLDDLARDIYGQPPDEGHSAWAFHALDWLVSVRDTFIDGLKDAAVLDVGCGQGFMCLPFENAGFRWKGVTLGTDFEKAFESYPDKVECADMTFLPFGNQTFDLIFARHVLEHSPFPILTLMEWRRVGRNLLLIAPAPDWWGVKGRNHYSVTNHDQLVWWLNRAGWRVKHEFEFKTDDPLFLKHLESYQRAVMGLDPYARKPKEVMEEYPKGAVEFRFICERGERIRR
jgi:SAM-dependent methyltransferase